MDPHRTAPHPGRQAGPISRVKLLLYRASLVGGVRPACSIGRLLLLLSLVRMYSAHDVDGWDGDYHCPPQGLQGLLGSKTDVSSFVVDDPRPLLNRSLGASRQH